MKQLNYNETKRLFKLWENQAHENVFLFEVTEKSFLIKAAVEYTEAEGLRVLAYSNGYGWELEEHHVEKLFSEPFSAILSEMHGEHCGDIYFHYEKDDKDNFETVYDCMLQFANDKEMPVVLDMQETDFSQIFDLLRPGHYMVHFNNTVETGMESC